MSNIVEVKNSWHWKLSILLVISLVILYIQYIEDKKAIEVVKSIKNKTCLDTDISLDDKNIIEVAIKNFKERERANTSSLSRYSNAMTVGMMRGAMTAMMFGNTHILIPSIVIFGSMEGIFTYLKDNHIKTRHIDNDDICHD